MAGYPKWIYHATLAAKIVRSLEEHEAHPGWAESPADVLNPPVAAPVADGVPTFLAGAIEGPVLSEVPTGAMPTGDCPADPTFPSAPLTRAQKRAAARADKAQG